MISIEQTVVINKPVEQVFDYLTDVEKMVEWQSSRSEATKTSDGPVGVGTTSSRIANFLGRRIETVMETVEFDPNKLVVNKSISGPMSPMQERLTFESVEGGTKLSVLLEGEIGGLFKLAAPLVARRARSQVNNDMETIKDLLESAD